MEIEKWQDIYDEQDKLFNECELLINSLAKDIDADVNDWCNMHRISSRIINYVDKAIVLSTFYNLENEMESQKDNFLVQKELKFFLEDFKKEYERNIEVCRTWKMRDYRCVRFFERLEYFFVQIYRFMVD
ncbi:MAG: hypothetical protein K0S71_378 [Clostridia bacterium]|jgi:hypothetical protein|nr:hypothetical protein [Clostridia bacterium]